MIREQHGDLLKSQADALVNTVNTVGVMGKGVALQFKRAFPANFKAYKRACDDGRVALGHMFVWYAGELAGSQPRYVINFPTKRHWKGKSRLQDIDAGLVDLVQVVEELGIRSVAVPPLGCGHGGLAWHDVRPLIVNAFRQIPDVEVLLFPPEGAPAPAEQLVRTQRPKMTRGKAALIGIMDRYLPFALEITSVDIQKLMYFMQEAGEPLRLRYAKGRYGPYADNLRHVLSAMEGHHISGVGDQSAKALDVVPFELLPGALPEAEAELSHHPRTRERFDRVINLIEGFESTYGLELLATVHWAATRDSAGNRAQSASADDVVKIVQSWNTRKGRIFTQRHIRIALDRLDGQGWLDSDPGGLLTTGA